MAQPLDLVTEFGEGWCVSIVRGREPADVLTAMGVAPGDVHAADPREVPFGVMDQEMVLARALPGLGWTLAVEFDGPTGFLGWRPETLAALSSESGVACVATYLPNVQEVRYAENGRLITVTGPLNSYHRWGADPDRFNTRLRELGYPIEDDDETTGLAGRLSTGALCALMIELMTGISLDQPAFTGPWQGGTVHFDKTGAALRSEEH